jgi:two-component system phosphate regulon sensor histidine kinase PhoR
VLRVARPDAELSATLDRLRLLLIAAGLAALALAIGLTALSSRFMSRALRSLVDSARDISSGDRRSRLEVDADGELGDVAGSLNQMADEIQRTVRLLAVERERFETVLEGMTDGVIALDAGSRITLMNPAALRLLALGGIPRDRPLIEVVRSPALQDLVSRPEEAGSVEFEVQGKNSRRVLARIDPLRDGGSVLVLHDVTELRRLETVRRDFVANVSHELRTPMSIIRANAETLADGALGDRIHGPRLLDAILRHSERLSHLIGDLLDLSRLEAGRYRLRPGNLAVAEAVRRAVDGMDRAIHIEIAGGLTVFADDKALDQVLVNLVDNAAKHTPEDADVTVRARADGEAVRIEVRDTGPGIEPNLRGRVFERFYRVDPGRSREKGGTGLGLSIVKHLVESMHGRVGVDANEPRGSVFWVMLPRTSSASAENVQEASSIGV